MKKIFRMALVFALAGATLMYTGCTKDYGEEIDNLDGKLSALQTDLTNKVNDLSNEVSSLRSAVSGLESAYKAADDLIKGDVTALDGRVKKLEDAVKDLSKYATKDELKEATDALEKKIAEAKEDIKKTTDDLQKQINELKEKLAANEEAVKKLEEAQKEIDNVYGFLSDELRSIVFYPDFYFAGIEATSYDFGSFQGYEVYPYNKDYSWTFTDDEGNSTKFTFPKNTARWLADVYYEYDAKGNPVYYKYDPETYEWVLKDGKMVKGSADDDNVAMYFPANHLQGQVGTARYNLNPSSFPTDSAEWSLNGRNLKYVLKSEEEETWHPIFEGISKDEDGLASVAYSIENPEKIFSSVLGAIVDGAIGLYNQYANDSEALEDIVNTFAPAIHPNGRKGGSEMNWMERAQHELLAKKNRYNNIPDMQLVATLSDGRDIFSDWHAISSTEEFVAHLAFAEDNAYVTDTYDCGLAVDLKKDLYTDAEEAVEDDPSVPVKYNGGPIDLEKLINIHTMDIVNLTPYAAYDIDEFNAKYPGSHFEFELVPYTIGANNTSEDMYGKIDGSVFTPCYVESAGGKATSKPIAKDSEDGISAVGRLPLVLVTLVDDETKDIYAYGWFKILISKDEVLPKFFEIPDLGKVPFICGNYTLATKWHEFSFFVLESLKVDYNQFIKTYTFDGVWSYQPVLKGDSVKTELVESKTKVTEGAALQAVKFDYYDASKKQVKTKDYGQATYSKDNSGDGINDAFKWAVSPQGIGEGKSNSIYFKFTNGEQVVYFEMKADVAKKAKMNFASNKIENMWFGDIDSEAYNTVRISVPVPTVTPVPSVLDFKKNLYETFIDKKPVLALDESSDDIYKAIYGNIYNPYRSELTKTTSAFQFSKEQPTIATAAVLGYNTPLFVKYWNYDGKNADYTKLYATQFQKNWMGVWEPVMVEYEPKPNEYVKVPAISDNYLVATITGDTTNGYTIEYAQTDIAKTLLNLWSYKKTDQAEMLFANITTKNKYGSTNCVSVNDGGFHVRFIRPIDVDFAAQDIAEESQVDGANVEIIKFFDGITDWNNQKVIVKVMVDVLDKDGNPVYDAAGNKVQEWKGEYAENVIKTVNMYQYYGFKEVIINLPKAVRNHAEIGNPDKFIEVSKTNDVLAVGTVNADGVFTADTSLEADGSKKVDISQFNNLKPLVVNYRNKQNYADPHTIKIPVQIVYSWGTLTDYMVINVKDTGSTEGR